MKKIIALAAIALFMISCSGDDPQTTNPEDTVLLKKLVSTDEDGNVITYNYTYDGNKLASVIGTDGSITTYIYTGNYITYKKYISTEYTAENFIEYYDNGKIKSHISSVNYPEYPEGNSNESMTFTYNNNNTSTVHYILEYIEGNTFEYDYTLTYTDTNLTANFEDGTVYVNTYDGRNNPLKNISESHEIADHQNLITYTAQLPSDGQHILQENSYVYNDLNFPVSATIIQGSFDNTTKTYHYQYFYE